MTLTEAREIAESGRPQEYSNGGGWRRWLKFSLAYDKSVTATAYGSVVATFTEAGVIINAHGYEHRITTREAINYCLGRRGYVYSRDNVIYAGGKPYESGMLIPYAP